MLESVATDAPAPPAVAETAAALLLLPGTTFSALRASRSCLARSALSDVNESDTGANSSMFLGSIASTGSADGLAIEM